MNHSRKEKRNLLKSKDKSVEGIIKTINKTNKWLKEILKPLDGVENSTIDVNDVRRL